MGNNDSITWDDFKDTKKQVDVVRFLTKLGYQRSTKQFSQDHNKGLIKKNEQGLFTRRAVHQYANRFLVNGPNADLSPSASESRKIELQCIKLERENEEGAFKFAVQRGRYIPRQELYIQLAGRVAVLDAGTEQLIRSKASELIALVGGDQSKAPDFIDLFLSKWKGLLNDYANADDLEVVFKGEEIEIGESSAASADD